MHQPDRGDDAGGPAPAVALRHWAAAQEVAERWRRDAHAILAAALRDEDGEAMAVAAGRLVAALGQAGGCLGRREALRRLRCTTVQLDSAVRAAGGRVLERRETTGGRPAEWLELAPGDDPQPAVGTATGADGSEAAGGHEAGGAPEVTDMTKGTKAGPQECEALPSGTSGVTIAAVSAPQPAFVGTVTARANGHLEREAAIEVLEL